MTPDVNVLVAASRSDHAHYGPARQWLEEALGAASKGGRLLLMPMVSASFVRLVTHPRVFVSPTPTAAAVGFIDALAASAGVQIPLLGEEWPRFKDLCLSHTLSSNTIPDAWLAAAVRHHGDRLVTFDTGFRRLLSRGELLVLDGEG